MNLQQQIHEAQQDRAAALAAIAERDAASAAPEEALAAADLRIQALQQQQETIAYNNLLQRMRQDADAQKPVIQELFQRLDSLNIFEAAEILQQLDDDWQQHIQDCQTLFGYAGPTVAQRAASALQHQNITPGHPAYEARHEIQYRAETRRIVADLPVMLGGDWAVIAYIARDGKLPRPVRAGIAFAAANFAPHRERGLGYLPDPADNYDVYEHAKKDRAAALQL